MEISPYYKLKCVFVGEPSVGKTSIINLIHNEEHDPNTESTIGLGFANTHIELEEYPLSNPTKLPKFYIEKKEDFEKLNDNQLISLHIWDTAGSVRFRSIIKSYLRDVDICFLVFDMTRKSSLVSLINWIDEVGKFSSPNYVLVGTKSDLKNPEVTAKDIETFSKSYNMKFYIISVVQFNSANLVRRMIYMSVKNFHEDILKIAHENKEVPEHVQTSYYKKKKDLVDFYDNPKSSFCCFQ